MGLAVWFVFILGAIAGQLVTILNFFWFVGIDQGTLVEEAVQRGVSLAIREFGTATTSSTFPAVEDFSQIPREGRELLFTHRDVGFIILASGCCWFSIVIFLICKWRNWDSVGGNSNLPSISEPGSPSLSIRDIARHQLAEIRVRRNVPH